MKETYTPNSKYRNSHRSRWNGRYGIWYV